MTNAEKQRAEQLRQQLAPMVEELREIITKSQRLGKIYRKASQLFSLWQWGDNYENRQHFTAEQVHKVEQERAANAHNWARLVKLYEGKKAAALETCTVARLNINNYFKYLAHALAYNFQDWREYRERRGLDHIADALRFRGLESGDAFGVFFSFCWCGQWWEVSASTGNGWGYSGEYCHYYTNEADNIKKPTKPQPLTVATYRRTLAKLEKIRQQAEALQRQSQETARAAGLLGEVETLQPLTVSK